MIKAAKTQLIMKIATSFLLITAIMLSLSTAKAQTIINVLDQNITFYAENEALEDVIQRICDQFDLDFEYNSKLIRGKRVTLSVSNKSVKEVLESLMDDFYLIFEIDNNILMVRDYVPMSKHIDFDKLYNTPSTGFLFDEPGKKWVDFDFKLISNLIIIPVSINNSDTMNFILDTGVRDPIITELTLVEKLNLNYMQSINIQGLGSDSTTQAYQSGDNTISIPGISVKEQKINVILDENFQISQILGMPVHGLIGFNLFRHYIIRVDYNRQRIRLYKPQHHNYKPRRNDIVLPITFVRNKPIVKSELVQKNGEVIPVRLLVDTGASDALWLSTKSDSLIKVPDENIYAFLGAGLSGDLYGHKGRLSSLWLGGQPIPQPIVSYPEAEYIYNLINSEMRNGSIGGEILRRFTATFDYHNSRLILRPNTSYKEKFYYNMSGLEIINPVPGIPVFTINNVTKGSPAHEAGLQKNDQILSVNFRSHSDLSLNDINLMLRTRENRKIRMTILRNGEKISTSFRLSEIF
jgi:predicted aspartyl protease